MKKNYFYVLMLTFFVGFVPAKAQYVIDQDFETINVGAVTVSGASRENCAGWSQCNSGVCPPNPLIVTANQAKQGSKSLRFEFDKNNWILHGDGYCALRNEIRWDVDLQHGEEAWYGFSVFPTLGEDGSVKYNSDGDAWIFQIKNECGSGNRGGIQIKGDNFRTNSGVNLGAVNYNQWNDIVIHYKYGSTNGFRKYWINGVQALDENYNTQTNSCKIDFKIGMYGWQPAGKTIMYFDAIKVKKGPGLYSDVAPGSSPPTKPSCGTAVPWTNNSFSVQTGTFSVEFEVTPEGNNIDGVVGLSNGGASEFSNLACIVQFAQDGKIYARNGDGYTSANELNYAAGTIYHVKMDVDLGASRYDIYVTPNGSTQVNLGNNYAFRTEQTSINQLNNLALTSLSCGLEVGGFSYETHSMPEPDQSVVKYIILKADDLVDGGGANAPGRLSDSWQQFIQMTIDKNIKANLGIVGSMSNYPGGDGFWNTINNLLSSGRFELWNHGWGLSPYPSYNDFITNQNLVKEKTGTTMIAVGMPENKFDNGSYTSLNAIEDIEYIMFGDPVMTSKTVLARDINIEFPTFVPDYERFVQNYPGALQRAADNGRDYLCLQIHPNNHTPYLGSRQTNLHQIIDFLKADGKIFVTLSEYKAISSGGSHDTIPPSAPTGLNAENVSYAGFTLSWNAANDNLGVTGYDVFQNGVLIKSGTATSIDITGLNPETSYSYTVSAKDAAGNFSTASEQLEVVTPQNPAGTNIAFQKPVTASSFQDNADGSFPPQNLVDGNLTDASRWSASGFPQWVEIDLGANYNIDLFEVHTFQDRAYQYIIELKPEGGNWSSIVDRSGNAEGGTIADNTAASGRYVRLTITGASGYTGTWASLREVMIYGDEADNSTAVTGIGLDLSQLALEIHQTQQLAETVLPANASTKAVTWTSSNTEVATVDNDGLVTAVGVGTSTITVTTDDGNFTATCIITVQQRGGPITNLLSNGDMENGIAAWSGNSSTLTSTTAQKQEGTSSLSVTSRGGNWAGPQQNITNILLAQGQGDYYGSAFIKMQSSAMTAKITIKLRVNDTWSYHILGEASANTAGWTEVEGTKNLNWTGTLQEAWIYTEGSNTSNFWIDNVWLVKGTSKGEVAIPTNIALNKPTTVSAFQNDTFGFFPAQNLVDGNISDQARWSAEGFPQWAEIDLGASYNISKFELHTFQSRAYQYTIEVKQDGGNYATVVDRSSNSQGGLISNEVATSGRYVRINVTGASGYTGSWISLNELLVYGVQHSTASKGFVGNRDIEKEVVKRLIIYPNPVSDTDLNIVVPDGLGLETMAIYNITGKEIYSQKVMGKREVKVSRDVFATGGVYLLRFDNLTPYKIKVE